MKKKILSIAVVAAVAVAAAWGFNQSNNEVALADVALSNVEALASGEGLSECHFGDVYLIWEGGMGGYMKKVCGNSGNRCC